jgi:hypothetical protein
MSDPKPRSSTLEEVEATCVPRLVGVLGRRALTMPSSALRVAAAVALHTPH